MTFWDMDSETAREQELFAAALLITSPVERNAFLDRACDGNPGLREQLAQLFTEHAKSDRFFQECISDFKMAVRETLPNSEAEFSPKKTEELAGTRAGRYRLLKKLGEGGCGAVYLAEPEDPARRRARNYY